MDEVCERVCVSLGDVTYASNLNLLESPPSRPFSAANPSHSIIFFLSERTRCWQEMADLLQSGNRFLRRFGGLLR